MCWEIILFCLIGGALYLAVQVAQSWLSNEHGNSLQLVSGGLQHQKEDNMGVLIARTGFDVESMRPSIEAACEQDIKAIISRFNATDDVGQMLLIMTPENWWDGLHDCCRRCAALLADHFRRSTARPELHFSAQEIEEFLARDLGLARPAWEGYSRSFHEYREIATGGMRMAAERGRQWGNAGLEIGRQFGVLGILIGGATGAWFAGDSVAKELEAAADRLNAQMAAMCDAFDSAVAYVVQKAMGMLHKLHVELAK
jgi:hypothetical protein